jgi:D-aminoacyl-tRNA deacylase
MMLLFSSGNVASRNIAQKLINEQDFLPDGVDRWKKGAHELIDTKVQRVLDVPMDFETDCIIVLSTHRSKIDEKIFTAHYPGNWSGADLGGEPKTLNIADPSRLKILFGEMRREAEKIGWKCGLEADHHGPTGKVPIIFAEIGSGEEEWDDLDAASGMARAISRAIERNEKYESFFAVGGGHYPKQFEKMVLEGDLAIGHILPKYAIDGIDEKMFAQAIQKSTDKVVKVIILKDETNSSQKTKITEMAARYGIPVELL